MERGLLTAHPIPNLPGLAWEIPCKFAFRVARFIASEIPVAAFEDSLIQVGRVFKFNL